MLNIECKIEIITGESNKKITFSYTHSIIINTSIDNLTDTATIQLPYSMEKNGERLIDCLSKKGQKKDTITIYMGYEQYGLNEVFTGYITEVKTEKHLLILSCENEMYRLKNEINIKLEDDPECGNYSDFNIKNFFEYYVTTKNPNVTCNVIGNPFFCKMYFKEDMTMAEALDAVREAYPYVKCYFKGNVLYVTTEEELGKQENNKPIVFDPSRNMITDDLTYLNHEKSKICIKAVAVRQDCTKIEVYAPAEATEVKEGKKTVKSDYELYSVYCPEYEEETELQKFADNLHREQNLSRMDGSFIAFGVPFVSKGDVVKLHNEDRPEDRHGKKFVVEGVVYSLSTDLKKDAGYRQTITLGCEIK